MRPATILLGLGLLIACGAEAGATLAQAEPERPARHNVEDDALYLGPIGVMLEADYFRVPRQAGGGRVFPCRFRLQTEAQSTRFTQSCE